jgi:uncharacterized protein
VEDGVRIHASVYPRSGFLRRLEAALQGSFLHSAFTRSRLLYSTDESIEQWYASVQRVGTRDREIQLLRHAANLLEPLAKAEKWLAVKRDPAYSYVWILTVIQLLAEIEVLLAGEVAGREVIQQAMRHNSAFFTAVYADPIHEPKTEERVGEVLRLINAYLEEKLELLFKPLLEFLAAAGTPRTVTELGDYFKKRAPTAWLEPACEWLADRGVIEKVSAPLRLTEKSRVSVQEAAYFWSRA